MGECWASIGEYRSKTLLGWAHYPTAQSAGLEDCPHSPFDIEPQNWDILVNCYRSEVLHQIWVDWWTLFEKPWLQRGREVSSFDLRVTVSAVWKWGLGCWQPHLKVFCCCYCCFIPYQLLMLEFWEKKPCSYYYIYLLSRKYSTNILIVIK